ncbi:hypothetical protein [Candidatus Uabimicrobium sp. HlEnr_7]|uniref:hypothetical protein n=1 Tax=Candidatus Uabimicrobium helgolandensis TaxID=3095367 RepID=UPI003556CF32
MKNLLCILILTCCVFADHSTPSCSSYEKCDENTALKIQLKKALAQVKKLQKKNAKLEMQNNRLCSTVEILQQDNKILGREKIALVRHNRKLEHQVSRLTKKIDRFGLQAGKYDALYKDHHKLKVSYDEACGKVVSLEKQYAVSCKERDNFHAKWTEACKEKDLYNAKWTEACKEKDLYNAKWTEACEERDLYAKKHKNMNSAYQSMCVSYKELQTKNIGLQEKVSVLQKSCGEYQVKYNNMCKQVNNSQQGPQSLQANYSIKFVGKKIRRKSIEKIMNKLGSKSLFSIVAVKQMPRGITFDIFCTNSSAQVLAGSVVKSFSKKGIYAGVTKASSKEMTLRISPWSVYSS